MSRLIALYGAIALFATVVKRFRGSWLVAPYTKLGVDKIPSTVYAGNSERWRSSNLLNAGDEVGPDADADAHAHADEPDAMTADFTAAMQERSQRHATLAGPISSGGDGQGSKSGPQLPPPRLYCEWPTHLVG